MKHIWSILCKKSIIDAETNNINIGEVLEEITFHIPMEKDFKLPVNFNFDYEIISFWTSTVRNNEEKFYIEIEFVDPDKKILNKFEQTITFPKNKKRLRTRIKSSAITVTKGGGYLFKIKAKEKENSSFKLLTEIPLFILIKRTLPTSK
ncbi:MAG: hypothetical protein COX29_00995 [Candidatus Moranbacteria bacterium CG23_combo_of_CG06-09_8_20_14_all_35_22]|nr:MAG: hypothetical protein COX29_00995 [Candidatus Moranbacteria bacterium CG23_combo_of_CG06-09_8_20_14_all_35_22]